MSEMKLYDDDGNRLYLNAEERAAFLAAARQGSSRDRTLCEILHYTGCRPSELIEITPARIDLSSGTVTLQSKKKRKDNTGKQKIVFRSVPVPPECLDTLNIAHGIREAQKNQRRANKPVWDLTRVHVWRIAKAVMIEAGIPDAPQRTTKGLRHGFGINATMKGIQLNMLQKWMGHADMQTTAIYATAIGQEEQAIAARMWT
ncbi:MAG: site-specific integrase [Rhizobiaceae bacterium]|nr:site-specific integrase [Rhizobiaceae bacterium]